MAQRHHHVMFWTDQETGLSQLRYWVQLDIGGSGSQKLALKHLERSDAAVVTFRNLVNIIMEQSLMPGFEADVGG